MNSIAKIFKKSFSQNSKKLSANGGLNHNSFEYGYIVNKNDLSRQEKFNNVNSTDLNSKEMSKKFDKIEEFKSKNQKDDVNIGKRNI